MSFPFNDVEGFLSPTDREHLKTLSEQCGRLQGDYFEIGSYCGLSALCIAEGMPDNRYLLCFDWFEAEKLVKFHRNMKLVARPTAYAPIVGDFMSHTGFDNWNFTFGFIDHDHKLDSTIDAYLKFWGRIVPGGVLAFHDYRHPDYPEPTEFLDSLPHKRILESSILAFQKE